MNTHLELAIRRGYSSIYPRLEALSLWISNTLSELVTHDGMMMHEYKVRVKTVDSLIWKVDKLISLEEHKIDTFEDVLAVVHDLVGARVIVYVPREIVGLHALFMAFTRFRVHAIRIHHHGHINKALIDQIREACPIPPQYDDNQTGYFSVHYALEPVFEPMLYKETFQEKRVPYEKFELQLRTLLNHAWCEMQHRVVYKSDRGARSEPTPETIMLFANLSLHINACDDVLDRLCHPVTLSPTFRVAPTAGSQQFQPVLGVIQQHVSDFESRRVPVSERFKVVQAFKSKYENEINAYTHNITTSNVHFNTELAELYLKSGHHGLAYDLYTRCSKVADWDGKIWLRLAETCSRLGSEDKAKEVVVYIGRLVEVGKSRRETKDKDDDLFNAGAIIAWEYKLADAALCLGEVAIRSTNEENIKAWVGSRANFIYYKLDHARDAHSNDMGKFKECLQELDPMVQSILKGENRKHLIPHSLDTLAWYYHSVAEVAHNEKNVELARRSIRKAEEFMGECVRAWDRNKNDIKGAAECVVFHESMILRMKHKISLANCKVFVSYSHKDEDWLGRLQTHLKPLERGDIIEVWADTRIKPSQPWRREIKEALESSKVAILLVSAEYLASDFIMQEEVPQLLHQARNRGTAIMPLIISPCRYDETDSISRFQSVNPPSRALTGLSKHEQDEILILSASQGNFTR